MSEPIAADIEGLLRQAFAPVEPPESLAMRLETTLQELSDLAVEELESWELSSMRDPRNWVRPVVAVAVGTAAGAGAGRAARAQPAPEAAQARAGRRARPAHDARRRRRGQATSSRNADPIPGRLRKVISRGWRSRNWPTRI